MSFIYIIYIKIIYIDDFIVLYNNQFSEKMCRNFSTFGRKLFTTGTKLANNIWKLKNSH